jgi:hypothetical protein
MIGFGFLLSLFLIEGALHVLSVTAGRESPPNCSAPISKVVNLDLPCHLGLFY